MAALGLAVLAAALAVWLLWTAPPTAPIGLRPFGGLLLFGTGWLLVGARLRPWQSRRLGTLAALAVYFLFGLAWVAAWNAALRFRGHVIAPAADEPVEVLSLLLTWPWQVLLSLGLLSQ